MSADRPSRPARRYDRAAVADESHLLFISTPRGYELAEREGQPPAVGDEVEVDGRRLRVSKIALSPLPGDARSCAYLQAA